MMVFEEMPDPVPAQPKTPGEAQNFQPDRRLESRIALRQPCRLTHVDGHEFEATTTNIAMSGVAIESEEKIEIGDRLTITVGKGAAFRGTVVRTFAEGFAMTLPIAALAVLILNLDDE